MCEQALGVNSVCPQYSEQPSPLKPNVGKRETSEVNLCALFALGISLGFGKQ